MSWEQSDGEDSVGETGTDGFVDAMAETEVELCLPLEVDMEPDQIRKDVPIISGAVNLYAVDPDPGTQRRVGPLNGAKPKWPRHGFPTVPHTPEPHRQLPGAGAQPLGFRDGRRKFGMSRPAYRQLTQRRLNAGIHQVKLTPDRFAFGLLTTALLSPEKQLPGLGTESEFYRFGDGLPKMIRLGFRSRLQGRSDSSDPIRTPENVLMDPVARLQLEVEAMKCGPPGHQTLDRPTSPVRTTTSTRVPKFAGVTSWEQYRQVFDAIAQSIGWGDATAALQLLSHLEGDALNVALLVSEVRRATLTGLVGTLTEHYGSPGRLADYRRQFEKTARKEGEDPSIFAIAGRQSLWGHGPYCTTPPST